MQRRIVLSKSFTFINLDQRLTDLGWRRRPDSTAPPPILPNEPDMAAWTHPDADAHLDYAFHPAMSLRLLMIRGENVDEIGAGLSQRLPTTGVEEARQLLGAPEVESMLLGIHAVSAINAFELVDRIAGLMNHPDELVEKEASKVFHSLLDSAAALGLGILSEWKKRHPDRSALFLMAGGPRERGQLLRWLIHDRRESNTHIDAVLRTALNDPDWEVRATAMLAAPRLKAAAVRKMVRRVKLPETTREGVNPGERRILMACRQAAFDLLEGRTPPEQTDAPVTDRATARAHILRAVAGEPVHFKDRAFLIIHSLTEPLPDHSPAPDRLPDGIIETPNGCLLQWSNTPLCWIPPLPHWLGDELPRMRIPNPIRPYQPPNGFFIGKTLFAPPDQTDKDRPFTCSLRDAKEWCEHIKKETGLSARLPTAVEWEMAARGPDGRRFPWGNNFQVEKHITVSPWGVRDMVGVIEQWTSTPGGSGKQIICGGPKQFVCAMRTTSSPNAPRIGFRPIITL